MIVKFHARGAGRGSGPVDYLLGKNRAREGATLDRGDPDQIQALINSSPYSKKYTSGVLSFLEPDLDRKVKDRIMSSFERALLPGLDADQYSCLWVEHRDKGRLELNFVVPNIELLSGKRLQPYYHRADKPRINAWKVGINGVLNLHDPDDPINKRELMTPRDLPKAKQAASQAITDGLLTMAGNGQIKDRGSILNTLNRAGFNVVRQTPKSISIADPDGGRNIRLKGYIFEQDFRFGAELRTEIEAASERYRAQTTERIQAARAVYQRGIEIKRAENQRRHQRPQPKNEMANPQNMVMGNSDHRNDTDYSPNHLDVAGKRNKGEPSNHQSTGSHIEYTPQSNLGDLVIRRKKRSVHHLAEGIDNTYGLGKRPATGHQIGEGINDRTGKATIERIQQSTTTTRETTRRLSDRIRQFREATRRFRDSTQQFIKYVQDHIKRERDTTPASVELERSCQQLYKSAPSVIAALEEEYIDRSQEYGPRF